MRLQELKVGRAVEIYITRDEYRYRVTSKIEGTAPGKAHISLISAGTRVFAFRPSDYIEVIYKENDKMWKFSGVRMCLSALDGFQTHLIESTKEAEVFNRRDTFRLPIMTAMEIIRYSPVSSEYAENLERINMNAPAQELIMKGIEKSTVKVVVKDISESGVGFHSPIQMNVGDRVRVTLKTKTADLICDGVIIREVEQIWGKYKLFYGGTFTKVDKNLAKFNFAQQRLLLSKGRTT